MARTVLSQTLKNQSNNAPKIMNDITDKLGMSSDHNEDSQVVWSESKKEGPKKWACRTSKQAD